VSRNDTPKPGASNWNVLGRFLVFLLAATSIACLLLDFYGWCPMRQFTRYAFLPALMVLLAVSLFDRLRSGGRLWQAVMIGLAGGLVAAVAYDVFRLPFVFAREWGLDPLVPPMNLFKVFPRFGAMILGEPVEQGSYSLSVQVLGWLYHFSNGATFGVMYLAMIGDGMRRHWTWAVLMALVLELGMLLTPYPQVFHIAITPRFIAVTAAAHGVFGVFLGLSVRWLARKTRGLCASAERT
jgi:hypothetical protein